ncbi:MAG: hypothetical protein WEB52_09820 [Dehalococcoidia bacterium]
MTKGWIIGSGVAALALVAMLAGGSAYAFSDRGRSDEHAAAVALERRSDAADHETAVSSNLQEQQEDGETPVDMAAIIAEAYGVQPDEVTALHARGIGLGAIFKLYAIAGAKAMTVEQLLATIPVDATTGEHNFAFGQLKKSLSAAEAATLSDGPKNLGQTVSASRRSQHAADAP